MGKPELPTEYLGDGVYAIYDGFGIWLHANDHKCPTDRIYLEPSILQALSNFAKRAVEVYTSLLHEQLDAQAKELKENEILKESDPEYVRRLASIQDPALRAAFLEGSWDMAKDPKKEGS